MGIGRQGRFRESEQRLPSHPRHPYTGVICFLSLTDHPIGMGGFEKCRPLGAPAQGPLNQICWVVGCLGGLYFLNPMRFGCSQLRLRTSASDVYSTGGGGGGLDSIPSACRKGKLHESERSA